MSSNKSVNDPIDGSISWITVTRGVAEYDVTDLFDTPFDDEGMKAVYIYFDMAEFVADAAAWTKCYFILQMAVDGANYRIVDSDYYTKLELTAEPVAAVYVLKTKQPVKILLQLDVQLAGNADIPWTGLVTDL